MLTFVLVMLLSQAALGMKFLPPSESPDCGSEAIGSNGIRPDCKVFTRRQLLLIANCQLFDAATQVCHKCLQNYVLKNNQCLTSLENGIESPSHLAYGGLMNKLSNDPKQIKFARNPNCETFVDNFLNDCLKCKQGYKLKDKDCDKNENVFGPNQKFQKFAKPQILSKFDMCKTINANGTCDECYEGATMQKDQCRFKDTDSQNCIFSPEACYPVRTECLIYASNGICKTCPPGATNQQGFCVVKKKQNLCQFYDQKTKMCVACTMYAQNKEGRCVYKQPGCKQYNSQGSQKCIQCQPGLTMLGYNCYQSSNLMYKYREQKCISWKAGECVQCDVNFIVDSSGSCLPIKV